MIEIWGNQLLLWMNVICSDFQLFTEDLHAFEQSNLFCVPCIRELVLAHVENLTNVHES